MIESRSAGSIKEKKPNPVRMSSPSITESSKPFLQGRAMVVTPGLEAGASDVPSVAGGVLPLIQRLRDALETEGVLHCQWKGHWKRERWARGQGDIDLLV